MNLEAPFNLVQEYPGTKLTEISEQYMKSKERLYCNCIDNKGTIKEENGYGDMIDWCCYCKLERK